MSTLIRPHLRHSALFAAAVLSLPLLVSCTREVPVAAVSPAAPQGESILATAPIYVCPMHPHITSHEPGTCPICGMTLVLKTPVASAQAAETAPSSGVSVAAAVRQSLGIRTAHVLRRDVQTVLKVPARVVADAGGEWRVQSRVDGFIEKLHVRTVGRPVQAAAVIADIYAPELVQAQEELLLGGDAQTSAAERLRRFGIAERDIEAVRKSGASSRTLPLRAPVAGTVTAIDMREGSRIGMADVLVEISSRGGVRVEAQLFPAQRPLLGDSIEAHFTQPGVTDAHWIGRDPQWLNVVDAMTQTQSLRFRVDAAGDLALGSVLDAELRGAPRAAVLVVPVDAVIRTSAGARVLREGDDGVFTPVPVQLGLRYGQEFEITDGLAEHDRIVVAGQFLLDSEAQLRSALPQLQVGAARDNAGHRHD